MVQDAPLFQLPASFAFKQLARSPIAFSYSPIRALALLASGSLVFSHQGPTSFSRWLASGAALVQDAPLVHLSASFAFNQLARPPIAF
jgi:hypothetical protein